MARVATKKALNVLFVCMYLWVTPTIIQIQDPKVGNKQKVHFLFSIVNIAPMFGMRRDEEGHNE